MVVAKRGEQLQPVVPPQEQGAHQIVEQCLYTAGEEGASDVHIEVQGEKLLFRMRIDGRLQVWQELPVELHPQVISRLKVLATMDISERRRPQDGRFSLPTSTGGTRDFRICTVPMVGGEKAVIRVLQQDLSKLEIRHIGYTQHNIKVYEQLLAKPHGLVLHCGPTGSGKTTALYAAINFLSQKWRNVQTIEDPVEGKLMGVNQSQVNAEIGLTFANLLRSFLRQDCDVILVGEVRDGETANLAVQASLTGHLVLGTIHTNSAIGAITRLIEMGVPAFFVGAGLVGCVSQRLVRRLCKACRRPYRPAKEVMSQYGLQAGQQLYLPVGCHECGDTGYRGRVGIQEVLGIDHQLRDAIHSRQSEQELQRIALAAGMVNIFRDGVAKAVAGHTTIEEVYHAVVAEGI